MINTIQIYYQYDETEGQLPSGLPKGKAYCHLQCPHLDVGGAFCQLFESTLIREDIGEPKRMAFHPAPVCRNHEMQGR